jgi:transcriptional regulator with XRE-family HTH domain
VSDPEVEAEPIQAELARISRRVREGRKREGLTLQELAERCGLATSTIQKVETEQMIPSVAVLLKLARGLRRRDLVEVIHVRADERQPVGVPDQMTAERLSGELYGSALETWRITLQPGISSGGSIRYEGEELVVCEQGSVTFQVADEEYELHAGDTLHLRASIPHSWRNEGAEPVRFMVTGTLPAAFRAVMQGRLRSLAAGV